MADVLTSAEVEVLEYQGQAEQGKTDYRRRGEYRKLFVKITIDGAKGATAGDFPASAFGLSKFFSAGIFSDGTTNLPNYHLVRDAGSTTDLICVIMEDAADVDHVPVVGDIADAVVIYGYVEGIDDTDETDL